MQFDFANPAFITLEEALTRVDDGWIAQFRGAGAISSWIRMVGGASPHTHSAMLHRTTDGIDVLELREFKNGRIRPLQSHAVECPGQIDLFAPSRRWPEFDARGACLAMRKLVNRQYSYKGIWWIAVRHIPFLWRMVPIATVDTVSEEEKTSAAPFCSHAVSLATDIGGGVDPVPRLPHWLVEPSHLTRSLFYEYQGTIRPPADASEAQRWRNMTL